MTLSGPVIYPSRLSGLRAVVAEWIDMRICYEAKKLNPAQIGYLQGPAAGHRASAAKFADCCEVSLFERTN